MSAPLPIRVLGPSGIAVGAIGLGCMGMSWAYSAGERDDARSVATIHRALELGVTLIDTADVYGPSTNEELVGRALAGRRDSAIVATKAGLVAVDPATPGKVRHDGSPQHIARAAEASTRRLGVDVIDLYQLHRVDPTIPLEETWGAMADLVRAGKVRALGLSEVSVEQLEAAHVIHPVASVQSELSLWTRDPLEDVLPWCRDHDVAFIAFAPLGRGFLTGAITAPAFERGDFRATNPRFTEEALGRNTTIVEEVGAVAERVGATRAQVALAWALAQAEQVIPIPGTTRPNRVEENAAAAHVTLDAAALARLDALPAPTGARY